MFCQKFVFGAIYAILRKNLEWKLENLHFTYLELHQILNLLINVKNGVFWRSKNCAWWYNYVVHIHALLCTDFMNDTLWGNFTLWGFWTWTKGNIAAWVEKESQEIRVVHRFLDKWPILRSICKSCSILVWLCGGEAAVHSLQSRVRKHC